MLVIQNNLPFVLRRTISASGFSTGAGRSRRGDPFGVIVLFLALRYGPLGHLFPVPCKARNVEKDGSYGWWGDGKATCNSFLFRSSDRLASLASRALFTLYSCPLVPAVRYHQSATSPPSECGTTDPTTDSVSPSHHTTESHPP